MQAVTTGCIALDSAGQENLLCYVFWVITIDLFDQKDLTQLAFVPACANFCLRPSRRFHHLWHQLGSSLALLFSVPTCLIIIMMFNVLCRLK